MGDDGEPPAKRSKYNLRSESKSRKDLPILQTIRTIKLLDLNEDCLNEMFGHLDVIELCCVSRVCKRLQELATSYFERKYRDFDFHKLFQGRLISNQEARYVLCAFGKMITSMGIQIEAFHNHEAVGHVEERILQDVAKYCKELNILTLEGFCFTSQAVEALNLLSRSLTKLTLGWSIFTDCVFHLINFSSLKELILTDSSDCYAFMDTFPNLKTLKLCNVSIPSQNILHHFIVRHSQLEHLKIVVSTGVSTAVVKFVAKYVKNLREFYFYENSINPSESLVEIQENFLQLSEMQNMKYLLLSCKYLSIGNLLAKMVTNKIALTRLEISEGLNDDQTIEAILKMKYLKCLVFDRMNNLTGEHLIKCAKELSRLKQFSITQDITAVTVKEILRHTKQLVLLRILGSNFLLDTGLYNDILDIVKERRNGTKLEIIFRPVRALTGVQILVPRGTIQANENWLIIRNFT